MNSQVDRNQQDNSTIDMHSDCATKDDSMYKRLTTRSINSSNSDCGDILKEIGITIASDRYLNTIDSFWFILKPNAIVSPFDFVTVEYLNGQAESIGMIQEIQTTACDQTLISQLEITGRQKDLSNKVAGVTSKLDYDFQHGINIAKVVVIANSERKEEGHSDCMSQIRMPVGLGRSVRFSTAEEVTFALGVPEMIFPIPAGIIEMSNGQQVPVSLDVTYLVGPDTTHVNATGISGNAKTSYLLFLLQSIYKKFKEYGLDFAIIIFNTKEKDLLQIDKIEDETTRLTKEKYFHMLNLDLTPFDNVTYFLPRGKDGTPNSAYIPEKYKTYSYELNDVYDRLELLFSEIYDPRYNLSSIINYIYEFWPIKKSSNIGKENQGYIKTWTDLSNSKDYPEEIITHKSSLLHFQGYIQRFKRTSLFVDKKVTSTYLGKEIKRINPHDIFVVDVAMLTTVEEQSFVIGDVMKSIDEMYASKELFDETARRTDNKTDESQNQNQTKRPRYVLVFIDEINRFLPISKPLGKLNTVAEQIFKTVIAGSSRGTILFSAQQFKSAVDSSLHEKTGTHILAKVGSSELSTPFYNMMDENTKMNIIRLNKGELVMIHSAFRYPIKITFPRASFKKE